tara:strand:- start:161 stop:316 length:156 start_codon:yes stop_codon:yes gene_type:complete
MQFKLPHLQSVPAVFDVFPFVTAHVVGGRGEQESEDSTQYEPAAEHLVDPH